MQGCGEAEVLCSRREGLRALATLLEAGVWKTQLACVCAVRGWSTRRAAGWDADLRPPRCGLSFWTRVGPGETAHVAQRMIEVFVASFELSFWRECQSLQLWWWISHCEFIVFLWNLRKLHTAALVTSTVDKWFLMFLVWYKMQRI